MCYSVVCVTDVDVVLLCSWRARVESARLLLAPNPQGEDSVFTKLVNSSDTIFALFFGKDELKKKLSVSLSWLRSSF